MVSAIAFEDLLMSTSHTLKRFIIAAAAAFPVLFLTAPAQAAVIGSFDPAFGTDIPNLGFRGTFSLDVTGCTTGQAHYAATGNGCTITVNTISLFYYNATLNPSGAPTGTLFSETLDAGFFLNDDDMNNTVNYVTGGYFDGNNRLLGFDTIDSYRFPVTVTDGSQRAPIDYSGDMVLYFTSGFSPATGVYIPGSASAFLVDCNTSDNNESPVCNRRTGTDSNPATVTFDRTTTVPEPGTLALSAVGLMGFILGRRRRWAA